MYTHISNTMIRYQYKLKWLKKALTVPSADKEFTSEYLTHGKSKPCPHGNLYVKVYSSSKFTAITAPN